MIDPLLALRIVTSLIVIYFFIRTWTLCKHNGLLLLASHQVVVVSTRILMILKLLISGSMTYQCLLLLSSLLTGAGAYLIYAEFNKAYLEGRYASEQPP